MGWVNTLAFAPHGGLLAAMTWDGDVVVARAPASVALRTGFHPDGCVADFAPVLSPDGRRVVAPAAGGAGVWNVDGERLQLLRTPARPACSRQRRDRRHQRRREDCCGERGRRRLRARSEQQILDSGLASGQPHTVPSPPAGGPHPARPERLAHRHRRKGVADGDRRTRALARRDRRAQPRRTSGSGAAPRDRHDRAGRLRSGRRDAWRARGIQASAGAVGDLQPGRSPHRHAWRHAPSLGRRERRAARTAGSRRRARRRLLVQQGRPARSRDLFGRAGRDIQRRRRLTRLVAGQEEPRRDLAGRRPRRRRERRRQRRCRRPGDERSVAVQTGTAEPLVSAAFGPK